MDDMINKKAVKRNAVITAGLLLLFVLFTVAVRTTDVRTIGPDGTRVGFAAMNSAFHRLTGVHMTLYTVTDFAGIFPVLLGFGFAVLGLCQWIHRRHFLAVDGRLFALGIFYILMAAAYLLFEKYPVNYRPVRIDGYLEASYPSSTTLLVLCVIPTAMAEFSARIRRPALRRAVLWGLAAFAVLTVVGRLISGVHWLSDIIGGILLSSGLVMLYATLVPLFSAQKKG